MQELIDQCDAIYVCLPTSEHRIAVESLVDSGKPLFCEKPLGRDLEEAQALTDVVLASGLTNQVGLVMRYSPAFFWLRHLLNQRERSGRLLAISVRSDQYLPVHGAYASSWRTDVTVAGAGVLLEHSIHDLDMVTQLVGRITSLNANTRQVHGFDGIDDVAMVSFESRSGAVGSLLTIWHDMPGRPENRRVEVFCERLWCCLDGYYHSGPVFWQWGGEETASLEGAALRDAALSAGLRTDNEDAAFVDAVIDGYEAEPSVVDALRAHRVVDAVYRSARTSGHRVEVEL